MEDLQVEIWKPIIYKGVDYTGLYEVSNMGRVKSLRYGKEKILKHGVHLKGYYYVILSINKKKKNELVHRILYSAFHGEIENNLVIDHINSKKNDNRLENLKIVSVRTNNSKERSVKSKSPTGVRIYGERITAGINLNSIWCHLGVYKKINDASLAYNMALEFFEESNNINLVFEKINQFRLRLQLNPLVRYKKRTNQ